MRGIVDKEKNAPARAHKRTCKREHANAGAPMRARKRY